MRFAHYRENAIYDTIYLTFSQQEMDHMLSEQNCITFEDDLPRFELVHIGDNCFRVYAEPAKEYSKALNNRTLKMAFPQKGKLSIAVPISVKFARHPGIGHTFIEFRMPR